MRSLAQIIRSNEELARMQLEELAKKADVTEAVVKMNEQQKQEEAAA